MAAVCLVGSIPLLLWNARRVWHVPPPASHVSGGTFAGSINTESLSASQTGRLLDLLEEPGREAECSELVETSLSSLDLDRIEATMLDASRLRSSIACLFIWCCITRRSHSISDLIPLSPSQCIAITTTEFVNWSVVEPAQLVSELLNSTYFDALTADIPHGGRERLGQEKLVFAPPARMFPNRSAIARTLRELRITDRLLEMQRLRFLSYAPTKDAIDLGAPSELLSRLIAEGAMSVVDSSCNQIANQIVESSLPDCVVCGVVARFPWDSHSADIEGLLEYSGTWSRQGLITLVAKSLVNERRAESLWRLLRNPRSLLHQEARRLFPELLDILIREDTRQLRVAKEFVESGLRNSETPECTIAFVRVVGTLYGHDSTFALDRLIDLARDTDSSVASAACQEIWNHRSEPRAQDALLQLLSSTDAGAAKQECIQLQSSSLESARSLILQDSCEELLLGALDDVEVLSSHRASGVNELLELFANSKYPTVARRARELKGSSSR